MQDRYILELKSKTPLTAINGVLNFLKIIVIL